MTSLTHKALTTGILTVAMGLAGCGSDATSTPTPDGGRADVPVTTDTPVTTDAPAADVPQSMGTPRTLAYVINGLTIDEGAMAGMAPNPRSHPRGVTGFNLDGRFSSVADGNMQGTADCGHADFFSSLDSDQNMGTCMEGMARGGAGCMGGVDNQLPEIATTLGSLSMNLDVRATLRDQITQGKIAIVIRVLDVNGDPGPTLNDSSVRVKIYPVARPMFASCTSIGMPGQNYAVDASSLTTPTDIESARLQYDGRIVAGRLILSPPSDLSMPNFELPLPIMGATINLRLYRTQLRLNLGADRTERGNIGGYIRFQDLATAIATIPGLPITPDQIGMFAPILAAFIDIRDPAMDAMGCGERLGPVTINTMMGPRMVMLPVTGGIGAGLGVNAVRANIAAMPVRGVQAGMCGAM